MTWRDLTIGVMIGVAVGIIIVAASLLGLTFCEGTGILPADRP